jgi:putative ubiquitin-RnfH superfamily antitoxin RatB of RatAB toxin-antitoxin module
MLREREITVELAYGTTEQQVLLTLQVPAGTTVGQAIEQSTLQALFGNEDLSGYPTGVWGKLVARERELIQGDRIELYRPLAINPRDARRVLAAAGKTMGPSQPSQRGQTGAGT